MPLIIKEASDKDLLFAHLAIHKAHKTLREEGDDSASIFENNIKLNKFIQKHEEIVHEMKSRGIEHRKHDMLDMEQQRVFELSTASLSFESPEECIDYYMDLGFTEDEAEEICEEDGDFMAYHTEKMIWRSLDDVPAHLKTHKGARLTLPQVNYWARVFDGAKRGGASDQSAAAIAWSQFNRKYRKEGDRWVTREGMENFIPPPSGDAPQEVKDILDAVYSRCRQEWVDEHPADRENPQNKERCAQIAWGAVRRAGWTKGDDDKWVKSSLELYPTDVEEMKFSLNIHFKNHQAYHLLTIGDNSYVIMSLPNDKLDEPVTTKSQATGVIMKTEWKWPKEDYRVDVKMGSPDTAPDFSIEVSSGKMSIGALKPDFQEYFMPNGDRIVFRLIAETNTWLSWKTMDKTPYVLSTSAIEQGWIPPYGFSGLPKNMEGEVPDNFRWWTIENYLGRVALRDSYVEKSKVKLTIYEKIANKIYRAFCNKGDMFIVQLDSDEGIYLGFNVDLLRVQKSMRLSNDDQHVDFNLISHWWKGPFLQTRGGTIRHFDLVIGDKMFTFSEMDTMGISLSEKTPYTSNWIDLDGTTSLAPRTAANSMNSTPAWAQSLNRGRITLHENTPMMVKFTILEGVMEGTYIMLRDGEGASTWTLSKVILEKEELSAPQPIDIIMNMSGMNVSFKEGVMYVSGTAIAEGVWTSLNGTKYWSQDVISNSIHKLVGKPYAIGTHDDPWDVGVVTDIKKHDDYAFVVARIDEKDAYEKVLSGEYPELSVEAIATTREPQRMISEIHDYERIVQVKKGACRVCQVDQIFIKGE